MKRKMPYQQPQMLVVILTCKHMLSQSRLDVAWQTRWHSLQATSAVALPIPST